MEENKNYKEIYGDFECPDCGRSTKNGSASVWHSPP